MNSSFPRSVKLINLDPVNPGRLILNGQHTITTLILKKFPPLLGGQQSKTNMSKMNVNDVRHLKVRRLMFKINKLRFFMRKSSHQHSNIDDIVVKYATETFENTLKKLFLKSNILICMSRVSLFTVALSYTETKTNYQRTLIRKIVKVFAYIYTSKQGIHFNLTQINNSK